MAFPLLGSCSCLFTPLIFTGLSFTRSLPPFNLEALNPTRQLSQSSHSPLSPTSSRTRT